MASAALPCHAGVAEQLPDKAPEVLYDVQHVVTEPEPAAAEAGTSTTAPSLRLSNASDASIGMPLAVAVSALQAMAVSSQLPAVDAGTPSGPGSSDACPTTAKGSLTGAATQLQGARRSAAMEMPLTAFYATDSSALASEVPVEQARGGGPSTAGISGAS